MARASSSLQSALSTVVWGLLRRKVAEADGSSSTAQSVRTAPLFSMPTVKPPHPLNRSMARSFSPSAGVGTRGTVLNASPSAFVMRWSRKPSSLFGS